MGRVCPRQCFEGGLKQLKLPPIARDHARWAGLRRPKYISLGRGIAWPEGLLDSRGMRRMYGEDG